MKYLVAFLLCSRLRINNKYLFIRRFSNLQLGSCQDNKLGISKLPKTFIYTMTLFRLNNAYRIVIHCHLNCCVIGVRMLSLKIKGWLVQQIPSSGLCNNVGDSAMTLPITLLSDIIISLRQLKPLFNSIQSVRTTEQINGQNPLLRIDMFDVYTAIQEQIIVYFILVFFSIYTSLRLIVEGRIFLNGIYSWSVHFISIHESYYKTLIIYSRWPMNYWRSLKYLSFQFLTSTALHNKLTQVP